MFHTGLFSDDLTRSILTFPDVAQCKRKERIKDKSGYVTNSAHRFVQRGIKKYHKNKQIVLKKKTTQHEKKNEKNMTNLALVFIWHSCLQNYK